MHEIMNIHHTHMNMLVNIHLRIRTNTYSFVHISVLSGIMIDSNSSKLRLLKDEGADAPISDMEDSSLSTKFAPGMYLVNIVSDPSEH